MTARRPDYEQPHRPGVNQLQKVPLFLLQCPSFVNQTPEAKVHTDHFKKEFQSFLKATISPGFLLSGGVRTVLDSVAVGTIHQRPLGPCLGENVILMVCVSLKTEQSLSSRVLMMAAFVTRLGGGVVSQNPALPQKRMAESAGGGDAWQGFFLAPREAALGILYSEC